MAEDAWNSRDPDRVAAAYTPGEWEGVLPTCQHCLLYARLPLLASCVHGEPFPLKQSEVSSAVFLLRVAPHTLDKYVHTWSLQIPNGATEARSSRVELQSRRFSTGSGLRSWATGGRIPEAYTAPVHMINGPKL